MIYDSFKFDVNNLMDKENVDNNNNDCNKCLVGNGNNNDMNIDDIFSPTKCSEQSMNSLGTESFKELGVVPPQPLNPSPVKSKNSNMNLIDDDYDVYE